MLVCLAEGVLYGLDCGKSYCFCGFCTAIDRAKIRSSPVQSVGVILLCICLLENVLVSLSYLSDRSQLVQVETKQSPQIRLGEYAAPQGSVLGGTLFVIYENDFPAVRANGQSIMFVDDDTDCVSNEDPMQLLQVIQGEANLSCDWLTDNRMCVAGQKSKLMIIGTKGLKKNRLQGQEVSILVDGQEIKKHSK